MKFAPTHRPDTAEAHERAVKKVIHVMKANLAEWDTRLSVKTLANVACYSVPQFIEIFQFITGTTPAHFFASLKIQRAKELLLLTKKNITEISLEVGYASPQSFSKKFSDFVGISPSMYRKTQLNLSPSKIIAIASNFVRLNNIRLNSTPTKNILHGKVNAPPSHNDPIFIGIFAKAVPQGRPLCGTVLLKNRTFSLTRPQQLSCYNLLAAMVPITLLGGASHQLLDPTFVGRHVVQNTYCDKVELDLAPVRLTDPPILVSLCALL